MRGSEAGGGLMALPPEKQDVMEEVGCPRTDRGPCAGTVKRPRGTSSLCGLCGTTIPATPAAGA